MIQQDPSKGGAAKDRFWNSKDRPKWARTLYEAHVKKEIPGFRLTRSANPEPKIGPRLSGRTARDKKYEIERAAVESIVIKMRAKLLLDEAELTAAQDEQFEAELALVRANDSVLPSHSSEPEFETDLRKFENVPSVGITRQKPEKETQVAVTPVDTQSETSIEDQVDYLQWCRRVARLAEVKITISGAAYTFARFALAAIQDADGDPHRVDWAQVEMTATRQSIEVDGQEPDLVLDTLLLFSPGQVSEVHRERLHQFVASFVNASRDRDGFDRA